MKGYENMHVLRPLFVFAGLILIFLVVRSFAVPPGFGIHDGEYIYAWYDQANLETWKSVQVKYRGREYCQGCHATEFGQTSASSHAPIQCESCHSPAVNHPTDPPRLAIDRSRDLCLRCHADLPATLSGRAAITGKDPETHNPGIECVTCHQPHNPT
jgi:predicted CXXCH cytochrome family protein